MPTPTRRYDLLAIDLDGTLFDPEGRVSPANAEALRRARGAGVRVVVCTGRGLIECAQGLEAIAQEDPVVVAGGAIIACPRTRRTLHRYAINQDLAGRAVARVLEHGHAAFILKDPSVAGYDYLVVHGEPRRELDPVTRWWFDSMNVVVRYAANLREDEHPEHSVRVGACGRAAVMARVRKDLESFVGPAAFVHHFPAVVAPEHVRDDGVGGTLDVLEVFDKEASKWSAVSRLASGWGIKPESIAAIGDQINDLSMIRGAGLGVAMGNAVEAVRAAATRQTLSNTQDGVAHAVHNILDGRW